MHWSFGKKWLNYWTFQWGLLMIFGVSCMRLFEFLFWFCSSEKREGPTSSSWWGPRRIHYINKKNLKRKAQKELTSPPFRPFPPAWGKRKAWNFLSSTSRKSKVFILWAFLFYQLARKMGEAGKWFPPKILEERVQASSLKIDRWTDVQH